MRVKNEILASRSKEAVENRFRYLAFLSREFFRSPSPYRRLLLNAYGDLAARGMRVKEIALSVMKGLEEDYVNLDAMNDPTGRLSRTDKWALTQSARILGQVGRGAVIFEKDTDVVVEVCSSLTFLSEISTSLGFRQLNTEVRIALDRMHFEIERLPLKRRASPLGAEYKKRIDSVLDKLESP